MRRVLAVSVLLGVLLTAGGPGALAAPAPPQTRCEFDDDDLAEVSGLVVGPEGPAVVNDSGNPSAVFVLDDACGVADERPVVRDGRDVEDLARSADGTLWIADIGDNRRVRPTVAVLRLAPDGTQADVALRYPDGPHDAETLILPADRRPVIVTKDVGGRSGVYTTAAPLPPVAPVGQNPSDSAPLALRRVGEVVLPPTTTTSGSADAAALFGGGLVTGGALSADRRVVALRTYTDAWLYPVTGPSADDVVAGLRAAPVQVPLPGEPQGEAVAFEPDGTLLSASETPSEVAPTAATSGGALRAVPGAAGLVGRDPGTPTPTGPQAPGPSPAAAPAPASGGSGLGTAGWVGVGVALVAGVVGSLYALRRR